MEPVECLASSPVIGTLIIYEFIKRLRNYFSTDRECPELAEPSLGTVSLSGRHFGGRATYTCPHGYHVVGLQSRLCQADGKWAGQEPACKQNSKSIGFF